MPTAARQIGKTSPTQAKPAPRARKPLAKQVAAAQAKTNLLRMLATVEEAGEYIITKRGKPVARLTPFEAKPKKDIYGCMKGTFTIVGDIMEPLPPEEWGDLY